MPRQILLFPDPAPLVERLGINFFRQLPESPGVYLMRGASDALLYVGKARNLRRRLGSYRVANPDRLPRRHLRLLRAVERIEIQPCADERAALEREADLLRRLKPRFNRAGVWPSPPTFFAWRWSGTTLQLTVTRTPGADWRSHGPLGAGAKHLRNALVRVLWFAFRPEGGMAQMPAGWFCGNYGDMVTLDFANGGERFAADAATQVEEIFAGRLDGFGEWVFGKAGPRLSLFERSVLEADMEFLTERFIG